MTKIANLPDRALSIRQPWAWAILNAGKRIENRPRRSHYRGSICIHASQYEPKQADVDAFNGCFFKAQPSPHVREEILGGYTEALWFARGGIIGTAEIIDCVDTSDSPWFFGPYGLVLDNVKSVPFIPVKGALGLFRWKNNLSDTAGKE